MERKELNVNQHWKDEAVEAEILESISTDEPWSLLEEFSQLTRLSGSEDEAKAAQYITDKLEVTISEYIRDLIEKNLIKK